MIDKSDVPETYWARDIELLDDPDIKARLGNLPVAAQVDLFLSLGWKQRLRLIRNSEQAAEIVRSIPDQEVLLTVKAAGEEDSLLLIGLTTPAQLRFLLDVEVWTGDEIDDAKARLWLDYLLGCGERKVIEFVKTVDRGLLVIMLAKLINLVPNEEGVKIPDGLAAIMPDEFFTILSSAPEDTENLRLLLRILRQWDRDGFYELLFQIHGSVEVETEEEAFRWRTSRLGEKGLLEFEEAVEIYGYIGEPEAKDIASKAGVAPAPAGSAAGAVAPTYPILLTDRSTFFYRILTSIEEQTHKNRLRTEIAFAANRLLVADARTIGEIDSMKAALNRLFALVNVGLLFLTGGNDQEARRILTNVRIRELFQIGFSRTADLKSRAMAIVRRWWPEWKEKGFGFVDYPYDGMLRGLMLRVPQFYGLPSGGSTDFSDFETMEQVSMTRRLLDEIAVVAEVCFDRLGIPRPHDAEPEMDTVFAGGIEEITLRNLMLTGFVNFTVTGSFEIKPLTGHDMKSLYEMVLEEGPSGERLVSDRAKHVFLAWLKETARLDEDRWTILKGFFDGALSCLEEEVGKVPSWENLDPRYVATLIFSGSRRRGDRKVS